MKNKSFGNTNCPIARSLEHVGEWWNILLIREAMVGVTRFDDFQTNLGIATSTLAKRLNALVESGILKKNIYCEKPPRYEYLITEKGLDFRPVILTIMQWGNKYYAEDGLGFVLIDAETEVIADIILVDKNTEKVITLKSHKTVPGPAVDKLMKS